MEKWGQHLLGWALLPTSLQPRVLPLASHIQES